MTERGRRRGGDDESRKGRIGKASKELLLPRWSTTSYLSFRRRVGVNKDLSTVQRILKNRRSQKLLSESLPHRRLKLTTRVKSCRKSKNPVKLAQKILAIYSKATIVFYILFSFTLEIKSVI